MRGFKNILLVLDDIETQEAALAQAMDLAVANQAAVTVVDVLPMVPPAVGKLMWRTWSVELRQVLIKERRRDLEKLVEALVGAEGVTITVDVRQGTPFLEIIRLVLQQGHDLVVKSVHSQNVLQRIFLGSADMHLLRKCPCPVWLVKSDRRAKPCCIVAAVDIEPSTDDARVDSLNRQILELSSSVAFAGFCELHIVHAWQLVGRDMLKSRRLKSQRREIEMWVARQRQEIEERHALFMEQVKELLTTKEQDYIHLKVHMLEGPAEQVIPRFAEEKEADLVVMGTVARAGIPGLVMGNTAEAILHQLRSSVLAVKPEGFKSPVRLEDV